MTVITLTAVPVHDGDRGVFLLALRDAIASHLDVDVHHTNTWPTPRLRIDADEPEATAAAALYLDGAGITWEVSG